MFDSKKLKRKCRKVLRERR